MIATACEERVDEFGIYLFTHYTIFLVMMCSSSKQTSPHAKVGLDAKINPLICDITDQYYNVNSVNQNEYVTISLPEPDYMQQMDIQRYEFMKSLRWKQIMFPHHNLRNYPTFDSYYIYNHNQHYDLTMILLTAAKELRKGLDSVHGWDTWR
jgi:hypothetical protein